MYPLVPKRTKNYPKGEIKCPSEDEKLNPENQNAYLGGHQVLTAKIYHPADLCAAEFVYKQ